MKTRDPLQLIRCKPLHVVAVVALLVPVPAQIGGDGSDGPFTPRKDVTLDTTHHGGTFQFTTVRIPRGVTVTLTGPNPARLLSQGRVIIEGTLTADAKGITPGPGGYRGGRTVWGWTGGEKGHGPGGGAGGRLLFDFPGKPAAHATQGSGKAPTYGAAVPFDLRGGSGGGGGWHYSRSQIGPSGGGGGGSLVLFADGDITISGTVSARGADIVVGVFPPAGRGGPGSGGSILIRGLGCVRISGQVTATGGRLIQAGKPTSTRAGDGFVRIDGYRTCAPDLRGATIQPLPLVAGLPYLTQLEPPRLGQVWRPRCASLPGDRIAWWMSLRKLDTPFPPFGTIHLDFRPGGGFVLIGLFTLPGGVDPLAGLDVPIPNDRRLLGRTFYGQAFNILHAANGQPRLSNLLTSTVR